MVKVSLREFETLLLLAIGELGSDAYGLAIHERLETLTGRSIALGQIYTSLARLEQHKLVVGTEDTTSAGRGGLPRKFYRVEPRALPILRTAAESYANLARAITSTLPRLENGR
jgi:DNA-binding PadR family transcriptional regulator